MCYLSCQEEELWRGGRGRRKSVHAWRKKNFRKKLKETVVRTFYKTENKHNFHVLRKNEKRSVEKKIYEKKR